MANAKQTNLKMLEHVANKLGDLKDKVVFVGGCTVALFITDSSAPDIRFTDDVDCIIDVMSKTDYWKIEKQLKQKGFKPAMDIICRWQIDDITVDVMPTKKEILGFSNKWYKAAIKHAIKQKISDNQIIKTVTAPYFLATKLEAFKQRGKNDFLASHDLEDIISLLDGRPQIVADIEQSDIKVKKYLSAAFALLLKENKFIDALPGYLPFQQEQRMDMLITKLKKTSNINLKTGVDTRLTTQHLDLSSYMKI